MRILIYSLNFSPELTGTGKYTGEMAYWFAEQGDHVDVITTPPYYPDWKVFAHYKNEFSIEKHGSLTIKRCPVYLPTKVTGFTRIVHEISFYFTSSFYWLKSLFYNYDVIISVAPPMLIGLYPVIYRFFRPGISFYHIQDLQIDVARELNLIKSKTVIDMLKKIELFILSNTSEISSISYGMLNKIKSKLKHDRKLLFLPNWVDTNFIKPQNISIDFLQKLNLKKNDFIILYSGNIGEKQGLDILVEVAQLLSYIPDIKFVVCGGGIYKKRLVEASRSLGIKNINFYDLVPYLELPALMSIANINLIIQKEAASDLLMPSKLTTILSSGGLCIITARPNTSLYEINNKYDIGVCIEPENTEELHKTILKIYNNYSVYESKKVNAREYALTFLNKDNILTNFREMLKNQKAT